MSRFLLFLAVAALAWTFVLIFALGQATGAPPSYRWQPFADGSTDQVMLVDQYGAQVGVWRHDDQAFAWRLNGDRWSCDCEPPIAPPEPPAGLARNHGVAAGEIVPGRVLLDGVPVSRARGIESIGAAIPDTQGKTWVTCIGTGREKIEADFAKDPALAPYRDRVILKSYPADHWAVRPGFMADSSPTVYVQRSDGLVMSHSGYDGPAKLAQALRKSDSSYDPAKDPDLTRPVQVEPILTPVLVPLPIPDAQPAPPPLRSNEGAVAPAAVQAPAPPASWSDLAASVPPGVWSFIVALAAGLGFIVTRAAKGGAS